MFYFTELHSRRTTASRGNAYATEARFRYTDVLSTMDIVKVHLSDCHSIARFHFNNLCHQYYLRQILQFSPPVQLVPMFMISSKLFSHKLYILVTRTPDDETTNLLSIPEHFPRRPHRRTR